MANKDYQISGPRVISSKLIVRTDTHSGLLYLDY